MTRVKKKSPQKVDPFAGREAKNYKNPIPSREFIMQYLDEVGKPLTLPKIATLLKLSKPDHLEALRRRLRAMERDGQLIRN
ncbi:MAG: ribonuclease R, partial [Thiotrichaceae bacterium]|nr:ribonuclease R [Thiotrichaceae bacterium]